MVPFPCRILLALAGLIVPRKNRPEWRREWDAELAYRQRSVASLAYMVRCARGSFRDAAWIRAQTPLSLAFLTAPLRAECLAVAIAFGACLWFGALAPPHPLYANLVRLVRFERSLGILDITLQYGDAPLLWRWRTAPSVEQIATYTIAGDYLPYARVSPNFFEVLGTKAARGRLLDAQDLSNTVVITDDFWRSRFRSDAGVLGASFSVGYKNYTIAGVLPPGFAFRGVKMFAPLKYASFPSAIALLRPGFTPSQARTELYRIALQGEPEWMSRGIRLRPLASRVTVTSFVMAACLLAFTLAYLGLRRRAGFYIWARIGAILLCITVLDLATMRAVNHFSVLLSFLQFWTYLPLCAAAVYLTWRDQRSRCPQCFGRLKMPVPIGSWSSLIIDRPTTEYLCPNGHGALVVSEALHDPNQWTVFDESWKDLFAETTH